MEHFIFAAYLVLFSWIVTRIKFFRNSGLTPAQLVIVFLLKVIAGIIYGWIGVYYGNLAQMVDTWAYHYEALKEYELLKHSPAEFFSTLINSGYEHGYEGFFSVSNSWWNDLKANALIKFLAILNLISFGHYYTNIIFYSFLTLFGPIAIYRVMKNVFPNKIIPVFLSTFLIPSFLYWTSGLHKDGIIFLSFALISYHLYFCFRKRQCGINNILVILIALFLILIFRNFLLVLFIPAFLAWLISQKTLFKPFYIFISIYVLFVIAFFSIKYLIPDFDLPSVVVNRQEAFIAHQGGSEVDVERLEPNFLSFLKNTPQAISLSLLRPFPSDVRHLLSLAAAIEINLLLAFFIVFLIWRTKGPGLTPFILFCIFFSFSVLLMIGYTVNFLGAIVRYRSIVLPFLILPMMALIDWNKLGTFLLGNINNKNNIKFL